MFLRNLKYLLFVLGIIQIINAVQGTEERISPSAWGIAKSKRLAAEATAKASSDVSQLDCPTPPECDCKEDLGSIFYIKLVNYLFRKSRPIAEDFDGNHLINIHLQITEEDMKLLRTTDNVREIDAIVSAVIENSRSGIVMEAKEMLLSWYDRLQYAYLRVINSQTLMLVVVACLFLASVLCMRLLFKINLIAIVLLNLLFVSMFFNYLDCNRRLEFENLERMKSLTESPNPCDRSTRNWGLSSNYDAKKCADYMMSMHGHDRQFCEPMDFAWDFALNLFMKPTGKFLDTVGGFVDKSFEKYGLIKGSVIALIVICAMSYWMRDFLKSFCSVLWTGRPASVPRETKRKQLTEDTTETKPQPNVVNVHISLDPRAIGDYVQQVKLDEEKTRPQAIAMGDGSTPSSPQKQPIENVADGFDVINQSEITAEVQTANDNDTVDDKEDLKKNQE